MKNINKFLKDDDFINELISYYHKGLSIQKIGVEMGLSEWKTSQILEALFDSKRLEKRTALARGKTGFKFKESKTDTHRTFDLSKVNPLIRARGILDKRLVEKKNRNGEVNFYLDKQPVTIFEILKEAGIKLKDSEMY